MKERRGWFDRVLKILPVAVEFIGYPRSIYTRYGSSLTPASQTKRRRVNFGSPHRSVRSLSRSHPGSISIISVGTRYGPLEECVLIPIRQLHSRICRS